MVTVTETSSLSTLAALPWISQGQVVDALALAAASMNLTITEKSLANISRGLSLRGLEYD